MHSYLHMNLLRIISIMMRNWVNIACKEIENYTDESITCRAHIEKGLGNTLIKENIGTSFKTFILSRM